MMSNQKINGMKIRYIKLGAKGGWEKECLSSGIIRLGFNTAEHFEVCQSRKWDKFGQFYAEAGKSKGKVTETVGQVRTFFEDDGEIIWTTFFERLFWWCRLDPLSFATPHPDGHGTFRKTLDGWKSCDIEGHPLYMDSLSGNLTKLAGYQGTSCEVHDHEYVLRRINAQRSTPAIEAERLTAELEVVTIQLMRMLTPKDFELLIDLIFTTSGWRRMGEIGKTAKTVDIEMLLPSTGERSFIQVKSRANQKEFDDEYASTFAGMNNFQKMFFAYHTGLIKCSDNNIIILGPNRIAKMVIDAGLISWLIPRVG